MLLGEINKNSMEKVKVEKKDYAGKEYLDIRIYYQTEKGEWLPTKKGVNLNYDFISDLIKVLKKGFGNEATNS